MELISSGKSKLTEYDFLGPDESKVLFDLAMQLHPNTGNTDFSFEMNPTFTGYGKTLKMNRGVGFYSDTSEGYRYSGQLSKSKPLQDWMRSLIERVNTMFKTSFNGILLNYYASGCDYISRHSDDEKALSTENKYVVALSLGAVRKFRIRDKQTDGIVADFPAEEGKLLVMSGDFQSEYKHEIPVQKKITSPRISLTFREHLK